MALQGLPSILVLMFVWFIPESPRWYIAQGETEKAMAILIKYSLLFLCLYDVLNVEQIPRQWQS